MRIVGLCAAVAACGDYGGYKPSDRDNCVPCRERLPAKHGPDENCCRYLSDDPYWASSEEARARHDPLRPEGDGTRRERRVRCYPPLMRLS
jgi:hypothetical protein